MGKSILDIDIDFEGLSLGSDPLPNDAAKGAIKPKVAKKRVGSEVNKVKIHKVSASKPSSESKIITPTYKLKSKIYQNKSASKSAKMTDVFGLKDEHSRLNKFHSKPRARKVAQSKVESKRKNSEDVRVVRMRVATLSSTNTLVPEKKQQIHTEIKTPTLNKKSSELERNQASRGYSFGQLNHICNLVRQDILDMLYHAGSGHSAGSLDQVETFVALYFSIMRHDPNDSSWAERDILVQSNGHTVPARYAVMARAGYFPRHLLLSLRKFGSSLQGHPERLRIPALESTSGPLGSGLSQAAGMALSLLIDGNKTRRIYCTMGDGELNEGNIWEAAMFASKYKLGNLVGIVDRNNIQIDGYTEDVMPLEDLREKWESFGWYIQEVDGNNIESVIGALRLARSQTAKPNLIIAHTIPGKGVDFMEYDPAWHGKAPNKEQEKNAIKRLRTLDGAIEGGHL